MFVYEWRTLFVLAYRFARCIPMWLTCVDRGRGSVFQVSGVMSDKIEVDPSQAELGVVARNRGTGSG